MLQQGGKMATPPTTPGAAGGGYGKSITNGHRLEVLRGWGSIAYEDGIHHEIFFLVSFLIPVKDFMHDLCPEVLTVHSNELRLF